MVPERSHDEVFSFQIMPATGPGEISKKGDTVDLLFNIQYLLTSRIIPPEKVINEVLTRGSAEAGMSGGAKWDPYRLKKGDFQSLVKELMNASTSEKLEYKQPDSWVESFEDWNVWVMHIKYGIPWEEHKRLNDVVVAIEKELKIAKGNKDTSKINELHLQYVLAGTELSEYIMKHRKK